MCCSPDINLGRGMDGFELARAARQLNPQIRVVYASGRPQTELDRRRVDGSSFLTKPYFADEVVACVLSGASD